VLDILKEIFLTIINLAKEGEKMKLDIKIGTINVEDENKLIFMNNELFTLNADHNGKELNRTLNVSK
jgi:hypothetical protein